MIEKGLNFLRWNPNLDTLPEREVIKHGILGHLSEKNELIVLIQFKHDFVDVNSYYNLKRYYFLLLSV